MYVYVLDCEFPKPRKTDIVEMYPVQRVTCHELLLLTILYVNTCTPTGTCDILCQEFPQVRLVSPCLTLAVLKVLLGA